MQEMLECMQIEDSDSSDTNPEETPPSQQLMMLSCASTNATKEPVKSMKIKVSIQGKDLLFLIDSGSSTCFIDTKVVDSFSERQQLQKPLHVQVARGLFLPALNIFLNSIGKHKDIIFQIHFRS